MEKKRKLSPKRQALAEKWRGLPKFALRKFPYLRMLLSLDDAYSAAQWGLCLAAYYWRRGRRDGKKSAKFTTYAITCIKRQVSSEVARNFGIKRDPAKAAVRNAVSLGDLEGEVADAREARWDEELMEYVEKGLSALDERSLSVVKMYYYEGLTQEQMGRALGVTHQRVSLILKKALADMRLKLEGAA